MDDLAIRPVKATVGLGVKELKKGTGVRKNIEEVRDSLREYVYPYLKDAELSVVGFMKDGQYHYLLLAKSLVGDVEDFMEEYMHSTVSGKYQDMHGKVDWGTSHLLFLPSWVTQYLLRRGMNRRINDFSERVKKFKETQNRTTEVPKQTERPCWSSEVDESKILGRDSEKAKLKGMLGCSTDMPATDGDHEVATATSSSTSTSTTVPIIFITGPPGYGKTALAQFVIKDKEVKEHFKDNIFWVSVSGPIDDKKRLATAIIEAMEGKAPEYYEWDPLHSHLSDCIKKKKIMLLVLDDPSGVDHLTWDRELKPCLDAAAPGSTILVTTQLTNLSTKMGSFGKDTLPLGRLLDDDSWALLSATAFPGQSKEQVQQFETIGKELTQKCEGVPSVIQNLGYNLRGKETPKEWEAVLENGIWSEEGLLPRLLYVTYDAFPDSLQRCFKFCACLPRDCLINRDTLVKLWMALGFLDELQGGQQEMEDKGHKYFKILMAYSFLHVSEGNTDNYKLYSHVYAFAQSLAENESCYYLETGTSSCSNTCSADYTRHSTVILRDNDTDYIPSSLSQARKLRMLKIRVKSGLLKAPPTYVFSNFRRLRALDMSSTGITELPPQVSKLKFVKILILSGSRFQKLPETVCNLKNLQTLILNDCEELTELPQKIGQLTNLRHLENKNTPKLQKFPHGFGKLINLRTLSKFVVAAQGSRKGAKIGELKNLNLLQGHLEIKALNRVKSASDAMEAALGDKIHLQSLCLDFDRNLSQKPETVQIMEQVLKALKPNQGMAANNVRVRNYPETACAPSWCILTRNGE
ncbi:hypothetical protein MKW94_027587 [Papaver nudicaule]|uniref:NB-ARC domain-containing protein n=1 Tax=Papaver nudicaule TaxID=74823 RepID=A0AA41VKU1_PAPNU|nr:hypothetical protein [Papaver nudicaule]